MKMSVVFWQSALSIHQAGLIRAFSEAWDGDVSLVVNGGVSEQRMQMGWPVDPDYGSVHIVRSPNYEERVAFIASLPNSTVHIISGLGRDRLLRQTARLVKRSGHKVAHYLEPWDSRRLARRFLLWIFYLTQAVQAGRSTFFLSTSSSGQAQLRSLGIPKKKIYPFGYFLGVTRSRVSSQRRIDADEVRILYVGNLSKLKQPLLTAQIVHAQSQINCHLVIVGNGEDSGKLCRMASRNDRIAYLGALENDAVRTEMARSDFLILPSLYDGWGAVVSEALLEGTRVLVSNQCGVAQVIPGPTVGLTFVPTKVAILDALLRASQLGPTTPDQRSALRSWSRQTLTDHAGATYLSEIVNYETTREGHRPEAPWHRTGLA